MQSVEVAPRGPRPPLRIRPVPPCDPPFDDEVSPHIWGGPAGAVQPVLDWAAPQDGWPAGISHDVPGTHPVPAPGATATGVTAATEVAVTGASTDARQAVRRFVLRFVEVLNGYRPAPQLRPLCATAEAARMVAQAQAAAHRVAQARRAWAQRHRTAARHGRLPDPVAIARVRLCEPRPGAVEATVLLVTGHRTWALALRLERCDTAWAATVLQLL